MDGRTSGERDRGRERDTQTTKKQFAKRHFFFFLAVNKIKENFDVLDKHRKNP
jgi:hypothetical protein